MRIPRKTIIPCLCILVGLLVANFVFATEKIDINTAPSEDLVKIIHIGEVRALELISLRPFSSLDDLTRIKGIGEARLRDIKEQGLAWIAPQSQPEFQPKPEPEPQQEPKSEPELQYKPESEKPAVEEPIVEVRLQQTYPTGIIFNEILPSPEGPDEINEWIEIFNQNNFEADLSGWQISDTAGKPYTFPVGTKISAQGFLVLPRPTTKITLNNDEDGLPLIQPNGNILDSVNYQKAPQGQSYNRTESGWVWSITLTPGSANIIPASSSKIKDEEKNKEEPQKKLATVSESFRQIQEKQISKPLFVFLIASGLAIFSGVIILIFKKRLKSAKIER